MALYKVVNKSSLFQMYAHICLKEQTINGSNVLWNSSFSEGKIAPTKWPEMASYAYLVFKIFRGRNPPTPLPLSEACCILQSSTV